MGWWLLAGLVHFLHHVRSMLLMSSPNLPKWSQALRGLRMPDGSGDPNGIPVLGSIPDPAIPGGRFYQVKVSEFTDNLHLSMPNPTHLWGYVDNSPTNDSSTNENYGIERHLGGVIIATRHKPVRSALPTPCRIRQLFLSTLPFPGQIRGQTALPSIFMAALSSGLLTAVRSTVGSPWQRWP